MIEIKNFQITANNQSLSSIRLNEDIEVIQPLPVLKVQSRDNQKQSLSVSQFAEEAKITPQAVRKMINEQRLTASKLGEQYVIPREELNRYLHIK